MVDVENDSSELTVEGMLVVELSRALFSSDIDETFRILGRHMDKHQFQVSNDVIEEYHLAGRIRPT